MIVDLSKNLAKWAHKLYKNYDAIPRLPGFEQPFIVNEIGSTTKKFDSRMVPIGSAAEDQIRIGKFMASPAGTVFAAKQYTLQTLNPMPYTKLWNIASIPISAAPLTHASRHTTGLLDIAGIAKGRYETDAMSKHVPLKQVEKESLIHRRAFGDPAVTSNIPSEIRNVINVLNPTKFGRSLFSDTVGDRINLAGFDNFSRLQGIDDNSDLVTFKFETLGLSPNRTIRFRATVTSPSDSISPTWNEVKYIGRPDPVFLYAGASRDFSLTFDVAAHTKSEMLPIYQKLNYLVGLCYPKLDGKHRMRSPFIKLTIGNLLNDTPGFLSNLTVNWPDESPWEIDEGTQLPMVYNVSLSFRVIGKRLPTIQSRHYEINETDPWYGNWIPENEFPARPGQSVSIPSIGI